MPDEEATGDMTASPSSERRQHPRAHVDFDTDAWIDRGGETTHVQGRLVVLSTDGAFLELGEDYAVGTLLKLRFAIAGLGGMACQVIVRHCLEGKGVGTEFLDMDPHDHVRLSTFVEKACRSATSD